MKQVLTHSLFIVLLITSISCRKAVTEQTIAQDLCKCFRNMTGLYEQSQKVAEESNEYMMILEKLETAAATSKECTEQLKNEFGDIMEEREEEIKIGMQKECPEVIQMLDTFSKRYE